MVRKSAVVVAVGAGKSTHISMVCTALAAGKPPLPAVAYWVTPSKLSARFVVPNGDTGDPPPPQPDADSKHHRGHPSNGDATRRGCPMPLDYRLRAERSTSMRAMVVGWRVRLVLVAAAAAAPACSPRLNLGSEFLWLAQHETGDLS